MATKTAGKKKVPAKKTAAVPEATFSAGAAPIAPVKGTTKKAPAKKVASTKTKVTATKAEKPAAASGKVKVTKTKGKVKAGGQSLPRDLNEHGFVKGSDSEKIVNILLEGGKDRSDINSKVTKALGNKTTRNGNEPNVSSLIANVLRRLKDKGYTIDSTWLLVEPTAASKAAATRKANAAAKDKPAPEAKATKAPAAKKAVAKKAPAKKVAKKPSKK